MTNLSVKFTSIALSLILLSPNTVAAGGRNVSRQEVAKLITSAESPSDKSGLMESSLSILSAIFIRRELSNLSELIDKGEALAVREFEAEYIKWYSLIPENPDARIIASKNAREVLIKKYKQELDVLWPQRYYMNTAKRTERVVLESKLYTMEKISFSKYGTIVVPDALTNSKAISNFSAELMGRQYLESLSADLTKAIDISGPHGYMGYSMKSIQESISAFLNDIVESASRSATATTYEKRILATTSMEKSIQVILRAVYLPEAKTSFSHFLAYLSQTVRKGGPLCIIGGAIAAIGLLFAASSEASAKNISNSRLAVTRELNAALNAAPSLLSTKVIALKRVYGTPLVASVIAENGDKMLPLLKEQFAAMQRPEVKAYAQSLLGGGFNSADMDAAKDAAIKKAQIITAVRDNTYVKSFGEKMKIYKIK